MTQSNDFTSGNLLSKLLKFMLPVLGALILQAMYGAVDLLVVGRFGSSAGISAVSTGSSLINLVTFVITSLTTGVTVLISRYIGEGNTKYLGKTIGGAIAFFTVLAAILTAIVIFGADTFSALLNAPEAAHSLTVQYLRICGAGMIFVVAYNVISGIFQRLRQLPSASAFRSYCLHSEHNRRPYFCCRIQHGRIGCGYCNSACTGCQRCSFAVHYTPAEKSALHDDEKGHRL